MEKYSFEQLPTAVARIEDKLDKILTMLLEMIGSEPIEKKPLNIQEASKFLNLTVSTLYSKVCRREIPVSKKGKRLYFSHTELQDWIKSGKKKTVEEISKNSNLFNKKIPK